MREDIRRIDERIPLTTLDIRRYAEMVRQTSVAHMNWAKFISQAAPGVAEKLGGPENVLPDVEDIVSIGREPFCKHGFSPRMRCLPCMVDGTMAIAWQRIYKLVFDDELSDEAADAAVAKMRQEREG